MNYFLTLMFSVVAQISFAQEYSVFKTEKFIGVIFPSEYFSNDNANHFTPSKDEIVQLEEMLLNASGVELQSKNPKKMLEYLKNCYRQYMGVSANQRYVYINFIPSKDVEQREDYKNWKNTFFNAQFVFTLIYTIDTGKFRTAFYE